MENLIEPNIHPILVHFAYALTTTGAVSLFIVSILPSGSWRDTLRHAADWMIGLGVLFIITTVLAGFQAYYSVDHDGPSHAAMTVHRNWAVPTAGVIFILSLWRWMKRNEMPSVLFSVLFLTATASLSVTAWWGGKLVYAHGLGVTRLPAVTGDGHNHEHAPGEGHGEEKPTSNATAETVPAFLETLYPQTPEAVVDAYSAALRAGDDGAVRAMLAPDVIIAEGGGAERSVEEYAGRHMPADMAFTAVVDFNLKKRDVIKADDLTTVISESQVHGVFREQSIHSRMMETMVLRFIDDRWRIVHIHWSSASITGEHEH